MTSVCSALQELQAPGLPTSLDSLSTRSPRFHLHFDTQHQHQDHHRNQDRHTMDPTDAFNFHRELFDTELDGLINDAAAAATVRSAPPAKANAVPSKSLPRSGNRVTKNIKKRQKLDQTLAVKQPESPLQVLDTLPTPHDSVMVDVEGLDTLDMHALHVHPSRRILLDRRDAQQASATHPYSSPDAKIHSSLQAGCIQKGSSSKTTTDPPTKCSIHPDGQKPRFRNRRP